MRCASARSVRSKLARVMLAGVHSAAVTLETRAAEPGETPPPPLSPPADTRPPLPLPGENSSWQRTPGEPCNVPSEDLCVAIPACAWVKVYGTVPGGPAASFCHPRTATTEATGDAGAPMPGPR